MRIYYLEEPLSAEDSKFVADELAEGGQIEQIRIPYILPILETWSIEEERKHVQLLRKHLRAAGVGRDRDRQIVLVAPRDLAITIPAGVLSKVGGMKIRYQGPVKAPIAKGQHIADLVVSTSDSGEQVMPLVAAEAVGEAGFFARAWIGLKQLIGMA